MEAIKVVTTVKNYQVAVDVPRHFEDKEVEVIVLLTEPDPDGKSEPTDKEQFLEFLRNGPTLSEEELKRIDEVKQELRNWTPEEF